MPAAPAESTPNVIVIDEDSQQPEENTPTMLESFGLTRCVSVAEAPRKRSRSEEEEEEAAPAEVAAGAEPVTNLKPKRLVYEDIEEDEPVPLTQASPVPDSAPTVTANNELEEGEIPPSSA